MRSHYETSWWYWRGTAVLLTYGLFWNPMGFCYAGILSLIHLAHFIWRERSLTAFTVQVRLAYVMVLIAAAPAPMHILYVAPFIGTWAVVLYGYCFLARILTLMPWNRTWAFSRARAWLVMTGPTQQGSAFDAVTGGAGCRAVACEDLVPTVARLTPNP